ncbi:putative circumsporozoite protein [Rosellinia necatrix]|uniref:Putative circumsporozoite protein n=1 Tax=Rosellinia necatrix TaxID=77044 RepID=A0A1W2TVC3_ROSNE|nr:putative circumsporozoite protein [Rosellinia necatrix]
MRFSNQGAVAMAMAASVATATPHGGLLGLGYPNGGHDLGKPIHADIDLYADLSGKVLIAGLLADIVVDPIAEVKAGATVEVVCQDCHIKGEIDASISLTKVVPALSLSLKDVEVLLDLDVYIGAAATIAVNLVAPAKVSLPLPGVNVEALVYLDLILGVHTELDLSAGVYVSLPEASLETDILNGDILDVDFSGIVVKVLPIKVRIGCTELLADLRLRVDLGVAAAVDVDEILPLGQLLPGLDIPAIGAGLELAVYVNLLEYIGLFCNAPECPLVKESYGLNIGAAVELGVAVEDLLNIHLAPTVATALLTIPTNTICIPSYTQSIPPYTGVPTPTGSYSSPAGGEPTGTSYSRPGSGEPTSSGPASSGSATGTPTDGSSVPVSTGPAPTSSGAVTTPAPGGDDGYVTSTITNTATYTVTACAVNVPNCPAGYQTSATITHTSSYTTVCPSGETASITAAPTPSATGGHGIDTITEHVTTMSSCDSTTTFVPPTSISSIPYPSDVPSHIPSSYPVESSAPSSPVGGSSTYPGASSTASYPAGHSSVSYPAGGASETYPAGGASTTYPAGGASTTYPAGGASTTYPAGGASETYPAGGSSETYPAGGATETYPAGGASETYPAGGASETYPAGGASQTYPAGGASETYPAGGASETYPAGGASETYPAGGASQTYPAGGASTYPAGGASTYPAGGASSTYPAGGASTYPAGGASTYPAGGYPSSYPAGGSSYPVPTPSPSSPSYPGGSYPGGSYPGGNNSTATYETTPTASGPAGYPTGPVIAGAGKVGSSVAAIVALVGAVMVL